ncbi:hypothetical protein HHK36_017927 [Tetracentron sinense]|uniref:Uncharacterized protein n=1 Tax=Tetracentron sinense TaxID=13715 RepID=A0A834YY07_TETSI|nr:hypothetical protein HHK36_017927 [Tetracentron sinense]
MKEPKRAFVPHRFPRRAMSYFSSFLLFSFSLIFSCTSQETTFKDVGLGNPVLDVTPSPLAGYSSARGAKDFLSCQRVRAVGLSRLKISSYANSIQITLSPSVVIPERLYSKIQVCFHRKASLGLCQCAKDEWKAVQKGLWSSVMSPYEDRYIDVKFIDGLSGSVIVSVDEEFQQWRLLCLAFGFVLLLLAPIVSNWVPFYYSSSMAIGVLLVILILLFQGMKLLPTGRKNVFYLTIYGSVVGIGSFLLHYLSMFVNSILFNFGLSEDMHNPVSIFVLVGLILAGAAVGYWTVRKFVILEDGSVDVGIVQFVKWAMCIIATTFIFQVCCSLSSSCWLGHTYTALLDCIEERNVGILFPEAQGDFTRWCQLGGLRTFVTLHGTFGLIGFMLRQFKLAQSVQLRPYNAIAFSAPIAVFVSSTLDIPLAMAALTSCWGICFFITSKWQGSSKHRSLPGNGKLWLPRARQVSANHNRAEFLSRSAKTSSQSTGWNNPKSSFALFDSPIKGMVLSSPSKGTHRQDYYSTFHKTPTRKRFSKKGWEDFTRESTREAMSELASSPEFTDWIIEHADKIQLLPDNSSDDSMGSGSDSSEETGSGLGLFKWY